MKITKPNITGGTWIALLPEGMPERHCVTTQECGKALLIRQLTNLDPRKLDDERIEERKANTQAVAALHDLLDAGIEMLDWMEHLENDTGISSPPKGQVIRALEKAGCKIHKS